MQNEKISDIRGLDLEKAIRCAEYYSRSTEIRTVIIDTYGLIYSNTRLTSQMYANYAM